MQTLYVTKMDKDHFVDPALYEKWYSAMAGNPHNVYVAEILKCLGEMISRSYGYPD